MWVGAACSMVGMMIFANFGWDARDYMSAFEPYQIWALPYSPVVMIPVLGLGKLLPLLVMLRIFVFAYFSGWLIQLWAGMQCATPDERKIFRYVAPVITFFPGLLVSDAISCLNVAYILYGLMLAGAAWGWKRERWGWFYAAVLASSCFKVNMLTMLAIPLLCGRRQRMWAVATGAIGLLLYPLQSRIWPEDFQRYLISLNRLSGARGDFGYAPVGNLARVLSDSGAPYKIPCMLFYVVFAMALFLILLRLSRLYHEQRISFESWVPVMLLGVALLDPRILAYDFAWVSLPMAIVAWRAVRGNDTQNFPTQRVIEAAAILFALNIYEGNNSYTGNSVLPDQLLEMWMLLGVFGVGVWGLLKEAGVEWPARSESSESYATESYATES
jgi:hypothetical protein